jgi:hypothetical protein
MKCIKILPLLIFLAISQSLWAQKPVSEGTLRLALMGTAWSREPSNAEIQKAAVELRNRLAKNSKHCRLSTSPYKVHGKWDKDPLMANKVLIHTRCDHSNGEVRNYVANLKYDYRTNGFRFENVMVQGKRDPNNPKMETAFYLQPYDLGPLKPGWISGGSPSPSPNPRPYPTPTPPSEEDDGWISTVIGILTAGIIIGLIARRRKKKGEKAKTKPKPKGKKEEEEEEEEEHYVVQYNKERLALAEGQDDQLIVKVYKVRSNGQKTLAKNALIQISVSEKAIGVSNPKGQGSINTAVFLAEATASSMASLTVHIQAGSKNKTQLIPINIKNENYHLDMLSVPPGKKGLRPNGTDHIEVLARVAISGQKSDRKTDLLTQEIQFEKSSEWVDLGTPTFEDGWLKCWVQASNPDQVRNSIGMPKEFTITASIRLGKKTLKKKLSFSLQDMQLDVDKDRLYFLAEQKGQNRSITAFIEGPDNQQKWNFKAAYQKGEPVLSSIKVKALSPTSAEIQISGPEQSPAKGEKSLSSTLIIYAQQNDQEEPLERHVEVRVQAEGLYLETPDKEPIKLSADGQLEQLLEFGLYVWDDQQQEMQVPEDALGQLQFQLDTNEEEAKNIYEVLNPDIYFQKLVYNIPYGRYKFSSEQEIPGEGNAVKTPILVSARYKGKDFSCRIPTQVLTYGIGPDFPEWQQAYDNCITIVNNHAPYGGNVRSELRRLLEKHKMTLGVEGLNVYRKKLWKIISNLILAKGEAAYRSVDAWASAITEVLEWAEWMGNIAFNVLAAYYLKGYAPVASITKGVLVDVIIAYRENQDKDDFFWAQLEKQIFGLFKATEGRVIDVDRLEKFLGVNKAYAWLIFVSYHFLVNLYRSKSVVFAIKEAAREARDEIIVRWLLQKVENEAQGRGYKIPPPETEATINKVKNAIKKDHAGREYVDKKVVIEIMQDPQKVRTLKNHAPIEVQKAFEATRSSMQKAHDADLIDWISKTYGIPPQNIKVDDFRTPGAEGFSLNTDRDYRVVVRSGRKGIDGNDMWIEMSTKKWAHKSHEFFGKHTGKPKGMSFEEWSRICQQMPTDKFHIEASPDYSDQALDPKTGKIIKVEPNIMKVKAGKGTLIDPEGLGNMYHEKVDASLRDNNVSEAYAQCKKGVDSLKKVRKGYQKQGYKLGELPENMQKGMKVVMDAPVDDTATPARLANIHKQLKSLGFNNLKDFSNKIAGQFKSLGWAKR